MTASHTASDNGGALIMYAIAALIVVGAVAGLVLGGMGGMLWWFVALTFVALGLMVVVSIP